MAGQMGFSATGGVWTSIGRVTAPLATLDVFRDAIRLACLGEDFVFPRTSIVSLARCRGPFAVGIRIRHTVPLYPNFIVFWVCLFYQRGHFEQFKGRVEALGYEVK
jgi:hypothetical protein